MQSGSKSDGFATNMRGAEAETRTYDPPRFLEKGEEIMAFHLGSTVVLLLESRAALMEGMTPGRELRVGDAIAEPG